MEVLTSYGQIVGFYLLQASQICIVKVFTIAQDSSPLNNIRPSQINKIREVDYHLKLNNQVLHIDTKAPENLTAIPVANIKKKCVRIKLPIEGQKAEYIVPCPNHYEVH